MKFAEIFSTRCLYFRDLGPFEWSSGGFIATNYWFTSSTKLTQTYQYVVKSCWVILPAFFLRSQLLGSLLSFELLLHRIFPNANRAFLHKILTSLIAFSFSMTLIKELRFSSSVFFFFFCAWNLKLYREIRQLDQILWFWISLLIAECFDSSLKNFGCAVVTVIPRCPAQWRVTPVPQEALSGAYVEVRPLVVVGRWETERGSIV